MPDVSVMTWHEQAEVTRPVITSRETHVITPPLTTTIHVHHQQMLIDLSTHIKSQQDKEKYRYLSHSGCKGNKIITFVVNLCAIFSCSVYLFT